MFSCGRYCIRLAKCPDCTIMHGFVRREFYGFDDEFDVSHLMVRCREGKKRNVYFVSSLIKTIIECNTERIRVGWW